MEIGGGPVREKWLRRESEKPRWGMGEEQARESGFERVRKRAGVETGGGVSGTGIDV